jgi:hypothetical protein
MFFRTVLIDPAGSSAIGRDPMRGVLALGATCSWAAVQVFLSSTAIGVKIDGGDTSGGSTPSTTFRSKHRSQLPSVKVRADGSSA